MVSSPKASCRRPVAPSTPINARPAAPPAHGDHRWHRERNGTEAEQRRRAPRHGCDHDDHERGGDQPDVQAARRRVADAHGERALARRRVRGNVTQVVHHQQCARDRADRAPHQHAERGDPLDRDVRGADGRDEAEEREHEQLTEAEVAVGLGPSGVSPGRADARQRRRRSTTTTWRQRAPARRRPRPRTTPSAARFTAEGAASPDATSRTGPTRTSSVPRTPSE